MDIKHIYLDGLTVKRGEDGYLRVKGLATDDTLDLDQQICDPEWLAKAMPEWMEIGNVREMHQAKAVGKATEMTQTGNGWAIEAKVVDKDAAMKVEEDIYTGFSIGIKNARVVKDATAPNGRIVGGDIVEVSLVDRPANPSAVLEIAKSADGVLTKGIAVDEEKFADGAQIHAEIITQEVPVIQSDEDAPRADSFLPCSHCGGSGHKSNTDSEDLTAVPCEHCDGSGREPENEHEQIQTDSPTNAAISDDINNEVKTSEPEITKAVAIEQEPEVNVTDITKSVIATLSTEDSLDLRTELRKALGIDEEIATAKAAVAEAQENVSTLKAALDELRAMALPGGPVLRQTGAQANKSARATALNVEAERLRMIASQLVVPADRNNYLAEANRLDMEAQSL